MNIEKLKINGLVKKSGNSWYIKLDDKGRALLTLGILKENQNVACELDLSEKEINAVYANLSRNLDILTTKNKSPCEVA